MMMLTMMTSVLMRMIDPGVDHNDDDDSGVDGDDIDVSGVDKDDTGIENDDDDDPYVVIMKMRTLALSKTLILIILL